MNRNAPHAQSTIENCAPNQQQFMISNLGSAASGTSPAPEYNLTQAGARIFSGSGLISSVTPDVRAADPSNHSPLRTGPMPIGGAGY